MAETVADQVFGRVEALMGDGSVASRAAAIRLVAGEMDRSVSATSSAYYAGARKAREAAPAEPAAPEREPRRAPGGRATGRRDSTALYAEMAPLVEAGATVEQAARRFGGDEEQAEEIAAGFTRWLARQGGAAEPAPGDGGRVAALEAELDGLRGELERARRTIARAREVLDGG
jgi:hypothetical protein